jgi:error-prone DNA polymerase
MDAAATCAGRYAELHAISNFTFLRGASHPEELIGQAARLGYAALALTDECSMAGVVRAHAAARDLPIRLVIGAEFACAAPPDGHGSRAAPRPDLKLVVLAADRAAYAALCGLITDARRAAPKGHYLTGPDDILRRLARSNCLLLWSPGTAPDGATGAWLAAHFPQRVWIAAELAREGDDRRLLARWQATGRRFGLPLVASGNVHMHCRERRHLQDTLTAIRLRRPLAELGFALHQNGERHLRTWDELRALYPPALLSETLAIAERIDFSLAELRYQYPCELVPPATTPAAHLRALTEAGMRWRWPDGVPDKVTRLVEHELGLIAELGYERYFLTVHDIVRFARGRGILCQGRGSAANSAVCFCLGITEVDPARMDMLVERFISKERNEPPDIDVDFEHERREEVIQYLYAKYSRERAALAATVISYRPRSAIRDVGKALGLPSDSVDRLAKSLQWWDRGEVARERLAEAGIDPAEPRLGLLLELVGALIGFPRHLSQHVGGFVISDRPLSELVPVENAAQPDRTVIQWDKDDLEQLGLLKVDVLGLGMLSAVRRSFELINAFRGRALSLASVPPEDPGVYRMVSAADTMGVFQIESRAQMAMLPRLRPRCYYDLVIQVAIIRPGPIQGDMVHPYLRRRAGEEAVSYPSEEVRRVLERTLGVPIFQEQVMQLAIVAAGFTPGEADQLRRAMAAWRRRGDLGVFGERLIDGMRQRGYSQRYAERIFNQIKGFGEYGFPESHAASFALLVYVSAWLKCHEPAAFFCALLNSQPMGFYAPAQLVRAAARQRVELRPVSVQMSGWDCSLEADARGEPALRLGLRLVKGLSRAGVERLMVARAHGEFASAQDLAERAALDRRDLGALAAGGALAPLAPNRHRARWEVAGVEKAEGLLEPLHIAEAVPLLRAPGEGENILADYCHLGLTLGRHPLALLRSRLGRDRFLAADGVAGLAHGAPVRAAGLVITRQRPGSASGVVFVTLEDETGYLNLVIWDSLAQRARGTLLGAALLGVDGYVQKEGEVLHVIARELHDLSAWLGRLTVRSRDFH